MTLVQIASSKNVPTLKTQAAIFEYPQVERCNYFLRSCELIKLGPASSKYLDELYSKM